MPAISTARQFFDDLVARGTPSIEALVTNAQHETEWLDFKVSSSPNDDKTTWSEAVCGFGNNQGGVLIWGIDARKDKTTDIDAACDVKPVDNPAALRTRLIELLRGAVEPPLPGVDVQAFYQADTSGPGFVVCFIPESTTKPHRAELSKGKPYMIRVADAFQNPGPSLLRSLFFPASSPSLEIEVSVEWDDIRVDQFVPATVDVRQFYQPPRGTAIIVPAVDMPPSRVSPAARRGDRDGRCVPQRRSGP